MCRTLGSRFLSLSDLGKQVVGSRSSPLKFRRRQDRHRHIHVSGSRLGQHFAGTRLVGVEQILELGQTHLVLWSEDAAVSLFEVLAYLRVRSLQLFDGLRLLRRSRCEHRLP